MVFKVGGDEGVDGGEQGDKGEGMSKEGEGGGGEEGGGGGEGGEGKDITIAGQTNKRTRKDRATQPMDHERLR